MIRIYAYDSEASLRAIWGYIDYRPTLVRLIEERDELDYDDGRDCPGGDA